MIPDPILLVDDEAELREPLRDSLVADGYSVEDADSAQNALQLIARKHYPVILTDLNMPGGPSGLDLIASVKVRDPDALCVVITGYASLDVAIRALKGGAYDFIQKPFKLAEIEAVIDRALEHARLLVQIRSYREQLEQRVMERADELHDFHLDVLALNRLLLDAQGQMDEQPLTEPFLAYFQDRYHPEALAIFFPGEEGHWERVSTVQDRPWFDVSILPKAQGLTEPIDWFWAGGHDDAYLVPLRHQDHLLGILYIGFAQRQAVFQLDDRTFLFWCAQLEAAIYGLRCARNLAVMEVAKSLGWE
ncbi:MAG TPA: response regulator [Holophaga sp.]|jgi:two-component system NtrC family response regulator/two-component system response regulator PilR (NtrC family)|nr:response regulator [Holophaga sp.]